MSNKNAYLLRSAMSVVISAGDAIQALRRDRITATQATAKEDGSPVTCADLLAHRAIATDLAILTPELPVLSEESRGVPYAERRGWNKFWMVDPLDGTKEFIRGSDEYTVNVALIENGCPTLGVVYVPARALLYFGTRELGSFVRRHDQERQISARSLVGEQMKIATSRSHIDPATEALVNSIAGAQTLGVGSSLKFCMVADGSVDLYPRLSPTMEWDIAAGHALVAAAGGDVRTPEGTALKYNQPDLRVPSFIAGSECALRQLNYFKPLEQQSTQTR